MTSALRMEAGALWRLADLVEADFVGIGSGRIQSDRAGNERKAQEAFPVGAGGHEVLQTQQNWRLKLKFGDWFRVSYLAPLLTSLRNNRSKFGLTRRRAPSRAAIRLVSLIAPAP